MLISCISENLNSERCVRFFLHNFVSSQEYFIKRIGPVGVFERNRALLHSFESDSQAALVEPSGDQLMDEVQSAGAGGAVVVDVVDRDSVHANLVEGSLPAGGVAVNVAWG